MDKLKKLYIKAKNSPSNINFNDLCALAKKVGFIYKRQKGSHRLYKHAYLNHPKLGMRMNFQPDNKDKNKAKAYQVRQLLEFIDYFNLFEVKNV
ncbi:Toxin HicA [Candidatus Magnetomoraceae bacterium gMMP-15]